MAQKLPWTPWHGVVKLREDVRTGALSLADFAADLHDVMMQNGARPIYEDLARFFALTYPTFSLRELAKDVVLRLAAQNTKAIRQLELTYGGGKTHTLVTLRHLVHDPASLPSLPAVEQFKSHIGAPLPKARVVALSFDRLDVEKGMELRGPKGELRWLKQPWSVLAFQIAGDDGLRALHADGKAHTPDLVALVSATRPDRIELEKGLRRWTELSWFLDEAEFASDVANNGQAKALPKAWRLGNRPNLKQMHHDACSNRVTEEAIELKLPAYVQPTKSLTKGAAAAGARVHTLPERPRDIENDGEFHSAILGPKPVSDSGKPSAEARRFIDETTGPDRPRTYRNAVVLVAPSRDGLAAVRTRIREYLGWEEVRSQLKDQPQDLIREEMLARWTKEARRRIPEAIRQAWSIVVTVNEQNDIHAFKVTVGSEPLFATVKADKRSRIQDTAISAEAMLRGGPLQSLARG